MGIFFLVVGGGFFLFCLFLVFSFGFAGFFVCLGVGVLFLFFFFFLLARDQRPLLHLLLLSAGSPVTVQRPQGSVKWKCNSRYSA